MTSCDEAMTDLRETVSQAIDEALDSIDLDHDDLNEWERGVITDAAIAAMQPTLDQLARERGAALDALKVARPFVEQALEDAPEESFIEDDAHRAMAVIDSCLINARQALAQIDAAGGEGR